MMLPKLKGFILNNGNKVYRQVVHLKGSSETFHDAIVCFIIVATCNAMFHIVSIVLLAGDRT